MMLPQFQYSIPKLFLEHYKDKIEKLEKRLKEIRKLYKLRK